MILVTGGTGFIGTHLLEKLVANGEAVRALVRRTRLPRVLPAGVETVYGDLESGDGHRRGTARRRYRHPPGRRHQSAAHRTITTPATYAPPNNWCTPWPGRESAWSTSVRWPPSGLRRPARCSAKMPTPHPLTHYGKSKLEAERVVRNLAARCRHRAPARGLRTARYGCLSAPEIHLQRSGAGDRRRRALVQRDLRQGSGGRLAGRCPHARARPDGRTSWRMPNPYRGASSEPPRHTSWRAPRAC